jgi:uncharacterized UPF0160 family protein
MTKQIVVATHNGVFHADDVCAVALVRLSAQFAGDEVVTIRTRKESIIETADIVIDVGNVYDPDRLRFDHHQWRSPEEASTHLLREKVDGEEVGHRFSKASFGLVWDHFHKSCTAGVLPEVARMEGVDLSCLGLWSDFDRKVKEGFDRFFVCGIDAADVGFRRTDPMFTTVSQIISGFNPEWYDSPSPEDYDAAFEEAVEWAMGLVRKQLRREICAVLSRDYGQLAAPIVDRGDLVDGKLLVLDQFAPWAGIVAKRDYRDSIEFVLHPQDETWMIWQVPVDESGAFKAGSFTGRRQLPAEWAGKRNEELVALTGVEDAVFCHGARFCGGAGSREGAIAMARLALKA